MVVLPSMFELKLVLPPEVFTAGESTSKEVVVGGGESADGCNQLGASDIVVVVVWRAT